MASTDKERVAVMNRRQFVVGTTASMLAGRSAGVLSVSHDGRAVPVIVTSWEFGPGANAVGWPVLQRGDLAIDAVEAAINDVELLPDEL